MPTNHGSDCTGRESLRHGIAADEGCEHGSEKGPMLFPGKEQWPKLMGLDKFPMLLPQVPALI